MEVSFSMTEIWQLAVIKLLFLSFITGGIFGYWKKVKIFWYPILIGLFSTLSYCVLAWKAQVPWWGLVGDEIFVTAFLKKIASGFFLSDYFYTDLPPFYPPLYYWVVGGLGYILNILKLNLSGIALSHLGVLLVLLVTPILVYAFSRRQFGKNSSLLVTLPVLAYVVSDWQAVIFKPYEFLSAVLVVVWGSFMLHDLVSASLNRKKIIFYGVVSGLLFITYYFWFFLIILAAAIFKLLVKAKFSVYYGNLIVIGAVGIFIASPFLAPVLTSYIFLGAENWQAAWFIPEYLHVYAPFTEFSVFGLMSIFALFCFIYFWKNTYIKALFSFWLVSYLWQGISLFTLYFWDSPLLPDKPFLFFTGAVLSITAGLGAGLLIDQKFKREQISFAIFILAWVVLATQLLGGVFVDQPYVREKFVTLKQPIRPEFIELANQLKTVPGVSNMTVLASGMPEVLAFVPLNYYISYNIHFSHPAANFSQRYYFISGLVQAVDAHDFYRRLKQSPGAKIDALLLLKGNGFYPVNFWLDNYPLGGKTQEIRIPASLISEQYFAKIFEDKNFVLFKIK